MGMGFYGYDCTVLVAAIAIAFLQRCGEQQFITQFMAGARDLLGVAFIIGIARGVSFILNDGQISGTILHYATDLVQGMSPMVFLPMLMLILGYSVCLYPLPPEWLY